MAASGRVMISGLISGGTTGTKYMSPPAIVLGAPIDRRTSVTIVAGDNSIPVPSGATVCVIEPPAANNIPLGLGTGGAHAIAPNFPMLTTFAAGATAFILNATADVTAGSVLFDFA